MRIKAFCPTEDVPQLGIDIRATFCCPCFRARLDRVPAPFFSADEDGVVGRGARGIGLVGGVDVGGDGLLEDIQPVELLYSAADFL